MHYQFDWDPAKAAENVRKHKVTFRQAVTVFRDPHQLSIYDDEHSEDEDRWITSGIDSQGLLLVVIHTFRKMDAENMQVRIISARQATKGEIAQYQEENQ